MSSFHVPEDQIQDIFVGCWQDPDFQSEFLADPVKVLERWGVKVPRDVTIVVTKDDPAVRHIVIPLPPQPEEIENRNGGANTLSSTSSACRPCSCFKNSGTIDA